MICKEIYSIVIRKSSDIYDTSVFSEITISEPNDITFSRTSLDVTNGIGNSMTHSVVVQLPELFGEDVEVLVKGLFINEDTSEAENGVFNWITGEYKKDGV